MSDSIKTLVYAGIAVVVLAIAVFSRPVHEDFKPPELVGKSLFGEFDNPLDATELLIVKVDEDSGAVSKFEVIRDKNTNLWSIPSHFNYPADADEQMKNAVTGLVDLQVLGIASEIDADQETFGVIEPDQSKVQDTRAGVGLMVRVRDRESKELANLIIGKPVRDQEGQRFVRRPNQNQIYVVKIEPEKFTTKFEDWIERDLLQLNTFDVEEVSLRDYSVVTAKTLDGRTRVQSFDQRLEADIHWNSDSSSWELVKMVEFPQGRPLVTELLEGETLNTQRLNDLKTALTDMKIVGVRRKPSGLGRNLKLDQSFMSDAESVESLIKRGFFPLSIDNAEPELRSANGEVRIKMKDGVDYIMRFGETAGVEQDGDEQKISRYMFVMAQLDQSKIPPPMLQPLPEKPADTTAAPANASGQDAEKTGQDPAADGQAAEQADGQDPATAGQDAPKTEGQDPATAGQDAPKTEGQDPATAGQDAPKTEGQDPPAAAPQDPEALDAERERIMKENQRKQDEYDDRLKEARLKVERLNDRFADWYYIISEDVYNRIHLGRDDVITVADVAEGEGNNVDDFRKLEQDGLSGRADPPD